MKASKIVEPRKSLKTAYIVTAVAISCLMLGTSFAMILQGTSTPSIPTVIEPGSMVGGYSFVIFKDGSTIYTKNGTSGAIAYSSTSSYAAIQYAINEVGNSSGGSIYLKSATYAVAGELNVTHSNLTLTGDPGTVITSSSLPVLSIWGGPMSTFSDWTPYTSLHNIRISNLQFTYTGAVASGTFIFVHKVIPGLIYHTGGFSMSNIFIQGITNPIPTNSYFVALQVQNMCGGMFSEISITGFGTGVQIGSTNITPSVLYEDDHNLFTNIYVTLSKIGVHYYGSTHEDVWTGLKAFDLTDSGVTGGTTVITFISPQLEGFGNVYISGEQNGINLSANHITVENGWFNYINGTGISLQSCDNAIISNNYFVNVHTPIHFYYTTAVLTGNTYALFTSAYAVTYYGGIGNFVTINDGYVTAASGWAHIVGTTITVNHGMSRSASTIVVVFSNSSYGVMTSGVPNATQFSITVSNSGDYWVYWETKTYL